MDETGAAVDDDTCVRRDEGLAGFGEEEPEPIVGDLPPDTAEGLGRGAVWTAKRCPRPAVALLKSNIHDAGDGCPSCQRFRDGVVRVKERARRKVSREGIPTSTVER